MFLSLYSKWIALEFGIDFTIKLFFNGKRRNQTVRKQQFGYLKVSRKKRLLVKNEVKNESLLTLTFLFFSVSRGVLLYCSFKLAISRQKNCSEQEELSRAKKCTLTILRSVWMGVFFLNGRIEKHTISTERGSRPGSIQREINLNALSFSKK